MVILIYKTAEIAWSALHSYTTAITQMSTVSKWCNNATINKQVTVAASVKVHLFGDSKLVFCASFDVHTTRHVTYL